MAITPTLSATFTGVDISSAASVYSYAIPTGGSWRFQVVLTNAAGNGDYIAYAKIQYGGAGTAHPLLPKTTATAASGETDFALATITIDAAETDVISLWIDGLAGDTSVNGLVKGWRSEQSLWDELITGAVHNINNSAAKRLRQVAGNVIIDGTAVSSTINTIVLDSSASSTDGAYDPAMISIVAGTGAGQTRLIYQYTGATKTAVVDRDWKTNPANDSDYIIAGHPGREHVNEGLLRAATSTTAKLNANASTQNDEYNNQILFIRAGTGADQVRHVHDYDGATQTATVEAWDITPDTTSSYVMLPFLVYDPSGGSGAITFTYTLTSSVDATPIADATVEVYTDLAMTNMVASGVTSAFGVVVFYLDAGTYYLKRIKSDWTFTNPDTEVVS